MKKEDQLNKISILIGIVTFIFGIGSAWATVNIKTQNIEDNYTKKTEYVKLSQEVVNLKEAVQEIKQDIKESNDKNEIKFDKILKAIYQVSNSRRK